METALEGFTLLLEETEADEAVRVRDLLEAAGIPSKVRGPEDPEPGTDVSVLRSLYVPRNLAARARAVLERVAD